LTGETLGFMLLLEAGAVPVGGGKQVGVFKSLDIENMNQRKSTEPLCVKCGGVNETASLACFACISSTKDATTGMTNWALFQELNRAQCDYCGITMTVNQAYKCHAECAQVYCAKHIVKYGGGVK
jgi:hypothetical protein